ncbi:MAG: tetraether lipid synthase Tes [Methanoculleaceae archaeon]
MKFIKHTRSLCPECNRVLEAEVFEEDGKIWIRRTCPEDGEYTGLYWSDADLYHRFEKSDYVGTGVTNPNRSREKGCPLDCGLCDQHHSATLLANIDVTNRCNLNCDFCFANARACGYLYEPSFDQIVEMMKMLRAERPVPPPAIQFAGGEPTLRDDLVEIVEKAKELGFAQVQIATNGIALADDPDLVLELKEAGLSTVYLHFDGLTKDTNPQLRKSLKCVENCSEHRMGTVLVPTVIRGRNDHEVGDIIRYAAEHVDVVRGVNFQPVAFTGAARRDDVERERVTIPDLLDRIEETTGGEIRKSHFYPVPSVIPISKLVEAYTGKPQVMFSAHPHCGAATYVFVDEDGHLEPINDLINVDAFFEAVDRVTGRLKQGGTVNRYRSYVEGVKGLHSSIKNSESRRARNLWMSLAKTLIQHNFDSLREFHWNALFLGTMHFMDAYNYDTDRVSRCCIHYATPDGRIIPFCSYNSGMVFREEVWRKFSRPLHQ